MDFTVQWCCCCILCEGLLKFLKTVSSLSMLSLSFLCYLGIKLFSLPVIGEFRPYLVLGRKIMVWVKNRPFTMVILLTDKSWEWPVILFHNSVHQDTNTRKNGTDTLGMRMGCNGTNYRCIHYGTWGSSNLIQSFINLLLSVLQIRKQSVPAQRAVQLHGDWPLFKPSTKSYFQYTVECCFGVHHKSIAGLATRHTGYWPGVPMWFFVFMGWSFLVFCFLVTV